VKNKLQASLLVIVGLSAIAVPLFAHHGNAQYEHKEAGLVEFRAEVFNLLNHPDFDPPSTNLFPELQTDLGPFSEAPQGSFGQITKQENFPREIQLAPRIEF
jgi:hypothetical protein